jgi:hypothetical protein
VILADWPSKLTKFALQHVMGAKLARNVSAYRALRTHLRVSSAAKPQPQGTPIHRRKRSGDFEQKGTKETPAGTLFLVMVSEPWGVVDRKMMLSINGNLRTT